MLSIFFKDYAARLFRTMLQILFSSIAIGGVRLFDDGTVNTLVGVVLTLASLIPTALSSWKASRAKEAAKLLNQGETGKAKLVAAGQKL